MPKILLVEDNEMNRDMLTRRLEKRGYTVAIAVDGGEGVAKARAELPDLILMDMSLPVLDGWDATRQVKADPATAGIPIIALTAHAMEGDEQSILAAGIDRYLTKPLRRTAICEVLARYASEDTLPARTDLPESGAA